MDRVIRFERELNEDAPDIRVGDPAGNTYKHHITGTILVDSAVSQMILLEDAAQWKLTRHLVVELAQWHMRFLIEDRGRLPITGNSMQELKIQRHCEDIGIYDNHRTVHVPEEMNPHDVYLKLRLIETAERQLAEDVMWQIFWQLMVEPSYSAKHHWLKIYAPNFVKHLHDNITRSRLESVAKVMDA